MKIPDSIIDDIAQRLDIAEVVGDYVTLKPKGGRYWGLCPFHQEKTPSFTVTSDKGVYYCFGCHQGGSIYSFVMEMEKLTFVEAVRFLAKRAGVEISWEEKTDHSDKRSAFLELYRRVAGSLHHILMNREIAECARNYLQARGFNQDTLTFFQVGYAPAQRNWFYWFLRKKNYSEDFLKASGLFSHRDGRVNPYFRDRIIFPIVNTRGEVIAFGGRTLGNLPPKYLNSPETPFFRKGANLFGLNQAIKSIREEKNFILVEGYLDVLALKQCGIDNAVAPLGTSLTQGQVKLLKRYSEKGVLLFDSDEAGLRASRKAINLFESSDVQIRVVELSEGSDPADIMQKEGCEALKKKVKYPISSFQFLMNKALSLYDIQTPDGKEAILKNLTPYISSLGSQVKQETSLRLLGENLQVDFESVKSDFYKYRNKERTGDPTIKLQNANRKITGDLFLMLAVAANREYFPEVRKRLFPEDLEDPRAREIYIALEDCFREEENTNDALLVRFGDKELENLILEKISTEEFNINPEILIGDGIKQIRRRRLEKRGKQLSVLLAQGGGKDDRREKDLLSEKEYIDKELENLKVMENVRSTE